MKTRSIRFRNGLSPFWSLFPGICLLAALVVTSGHAPEYVFERRREPSRPPDILLIIVDDLNHWIGALERNRAVRTPNIDRLAARGVTFTAAYGAASSCNPSRAAFFSGLRPSTTGVYLNSSRYARVIPPESTLPSYFRRHGYEVLGAGKLYHNGPGRLKEWDAYFRPGRGQVEVPGKDSQTTAVGSIRWTEVDGSDRTMVDHHVAGWCIDQLGRARDRPLLLACGLRRPHLPWRVPKRFFALYPIAEVSRPPWLARDLEDLPAAGLAFADPTGDHARIVEAGAWEEAVRAYQAAVSYADHEVGRIVEALEKSPRGRSTVIVLLGDHGWHLGEKSRWRKSTLWEEGTRTPYIWVVPGLTKANGRSGRTVDLMSLYPTLVELSGLPVPEHLEGASIRPLLVDPDASWEIPAVTTMGYRNHAVRTEKWRYIRYADGSEELYAEEFDPYEWKNLAGLPEFESIKAELANWLPAYDRPDQGALRQMRREARSDRGAD